MRRIIAGLAVIVLIGTLLLIQANRDFLLLWNANSVAVTAEQPLRSDNVQIVMDATSLNDVGSASSISIFAGVPQQEIPNYYGENDFLIIYDKQYYLSFRQFKTNRRHQHTYRFRLFEEGHLPHVEVKIEGADELEFESPLAPINR